MLDPPWPFGHAAARWLYVLFKGLVERDHQVTVFSAFANPLEVERAREFFPAGTYDLRSFPPPRRGGILSKVETLRRPSSYMFSNEFRRALEAEIELGCDVLHLESLWSGWVGVKHASRALLNVYNLFEIDLECLPPKDLVDRVRRTAILRAEKKLLRSYSTVVTLTGRLRDRIQAINPEATVYTVPLGLDLSLYEFADNENVDQPPTVGLIGSFEWLPTYTAGKRLVDRLWPEIKRQVPEARLQIVGRSARRALADYLQVPGILVHENVPETASYFGSTDVLLYAPQSASGMKVKILEAFAHGTPVVTNTDGVEGLPITDRVHAGIADDDAGLIQRTVMLLRNPLARQAQRIAARKLLEVHCGKMPTLDAIEGVYSQMIRARGTSMLGR